MGFQQGSSLSASDKPSKQPREEEQGSRCQNSCCGCCLLRVIALRGNIVMLGFSSLSLQLKPASLHSAASNKAQLRQRLESGCRPSSPSEGHGGNTQRSTNGGCFTHKYGPDMGLLRNKIQNSAPCWETSSENCTSPWHSPRQGATTARWGEVYSKPPEPWCQLTSPYTCCWLRDLWEHPSHGDWGIQPHFWGVTLHLALW